MTALGLRLRIFWLERALTSARRQLHDHQAGHQGRTRPCAACWQLAGHTEQLLDRLEALQSLL